MPEAQQSLDDLGKGKSLSASSLAHFQTQTEKGLAFKALRQRWTDYIYSKNGEVSCPCDLCLGSSEQPWPGSRLCPQRLLRENS